MKKDIVKEYSNGEATIVWKPALCTHAGFCWKELPEVFDPLKRPWVNALGADTDRIIKQIKRCPSGALAYYMNNEKDKNTEAERDAGKEKDKGLCAEVMHNGPLVVKGSICIKQEGKDEQQLEGGAFCRCGKSNNQPFCDGSHTGFPFE